MLFSYFFCSEFVFKIKFYVCVYHVRYFLKESIDKLFILLRREIEVYGTCRTLFSINLINKGGWKKP